MSDSYQTASGGLFAQLEGQTGYGSTYNNDTTNPYFSWMTNTSVQQLQDVMVAEAVQARGIEVLYIRREMAKPDLVFGEDPLSAFKKSYRISVYIDSFDGWDGDGDWYSKFGFQVDDELNVTTNDNLFKTQADGKGVTMGDLVYFPLSQALFEINWVETDDPLFSMGALPMRKIKLTRFVYSGEEIAVEQPASYIDTIDDIMGGAVEDEDIQIINNLDKQWDILTQPGAEVDQIQDEVDAFYEGEQVVPNGSDVIPPPPASKMPGLRKQNATMTTNL
ncbi:head closure Hc2 [Vibrio phage D479]